MLGIGAAVSGATGSGVDSSAGAADSAAVGVGAGAGARITVGAILTTGRTATVMRRESSGAHAWALAM